MYRVMIFAATLLWLGPSCAAQSSVGVAAGRWTVIQLRQKPLRCEVTIALQGQWLKLALGVFFGDIERNPPVVAHVRRDGVAWVLRHEQLRVDTHPE